MALKAIKTWTPCRSWDQFDLVLTVEQVMLIMRMSKPTVLKLLGDGTIPAQKIGNKWYISRDALRRFLEGKEKRFESV